MPKIPQSYTDATSVEGLADLYREQPNDAHIVLQRHTVQKFINRDITLLEACQSGCFPHTLPTEVRKPKRLIVHRRKLKKMLNFFSKGHRVRSISEMDLWHWYLHVSFDFEAMNLRPGTIHKKEMEDNKHIRMHFDSATLKSLRRMVHTIQSQFAEQDAVVLPTFNKQWRKHASFEEADWNNPDHPLNEFLIHHQEQPVFGDFYIGLFDGDLASREEPDRKPLHRKFKQKERAKKNKRLRSQSSMMLNPFDLRPCHRSKHRPRFR